MLRLLKALVVQEKAKPRNLSAKYFLAMDIIRQFGNVELTVSQLGDLARFVTALLTQAFPAGVSQLPEYPGAGLPVNIFHVLALCTQTNSQNGEALCSAVRAVPGLVTRANLRAARLTPLHIAAECNNRTVAEFLVHRDEGLLQAEDEEGCTPVEVAGNAGNTSIARFLEDRENVYRRRRSLTKATTELLRPVEPSTVM